MVLAASNAHFQLAAFLLDQGADPNASAGYTALHVISAMRKSGVGDNDPAPEGSGNMSSLEFTKKLIDKGANIDARMTKSIKFGLTALNTMGATPYMLAAKTADAELMRYLAKLGADPNAAAAGYTALHVISPMRKSGFGDNDPAPEGSGNMSSLEFTKKLVDKGANINARMTKSIKFGLTALNTMGATPYMLAAKTADAELMRYLAKIGADPKIPNADNSTPLMAAAGLGTRSPGEDAGTEDEVVEALQVALDLGADINAVDDKGETAMHGAAYKNSPKAVEFLAAKGAKREIWDKPNKQGWTPLTIAEGHRFGNFKPSLVTVEAFHRVMGSEPSKAAR